MHIRHIAAGHYHSAIIADEGTVWMWGFGSSGQLGNGELYNSEVPFRLDLDFKVTDLSCGRFHTVAIPENGNIYSWGGNEQKQLGLAIHPKSHTGNGVAVPKLVGSLQGINFSNAICGWGHTIAVSKQLKKVWGWGWNKDGQLGLGNTVESVSTPTEIEALRGVNIKSIAAHMDHNAIVTDKGEVITWGHGLYMQLGNGTKTNKLLPTVVDALKNLEIIQVKCGWGHFNGINKRWFCLHLGLESRRTIGCWGRN